MLHYAIRFGGVLTRLSGLWNVVSARAQKLTVSNLELRCAGLPKALDGFTILHLSDLHLEAMPEFADVVLAHLDALHADIAIITGDFQIDEDRTDPDRALGLIRPVIGALKVRHGIYGVLGNHDSWKIVEPLEQLGLRMLINEHATIELGEDAIHLSGIDDAHAFYTDAAVKTIQDRAAGFRILLAHTPEVADLAAAAGCDLYLTGHTHGGQICLPNGRPLAAGLDRNRELASGYWRIGGMQGYTNRGLGTASLPMRINCPAEIAILRLRAAAA
jgi:predicted MPP superfamily phosphohydrolase